MKSIATILTSLALLAVPLAAQDDTAPNGGSCYIYDANGDEIWHGPCDGQGSYTDSCVEGGSVPPSCPVEKCSGGVVGKIQNGEKCIEGKAKKYNADGVLIEEKLICYCDVPGGFAANPVLCALGFVLGLGLFRRRLI